MVKVNPRTRIHTWFEIMWWRKQHQRTTFQQNKSFSLSLCLSLSQIQYKIQNKYMRHHENTQRESQRVRMNRERNENLDCSFSPKIKLKCWDWINLMLQHRCSLRCKLQFVLSSWSSSSYNKSNNSHKPKHQYQVSDRYHY